MVANNSNLMYRSRDRIVIENCKHALLYEAYTKGQERARKKETKKKKNG